MKPAIDILCLLTLGLTAILKAGPGATAGLDAPPASPTPSTTSSAPLATKTWIGGVGNWSDGAKWSPAGTPSGPDVIVIDGSAATISVVTLDVDFGITTGSLAIESGDKLVIPVGRTLHVFGFGVEIGTLTNSGILANSGNILAQFGGKIDNFGTVENDGSISRVGDRHRRPAGDSSRPVVRGADGVS